MGSAATPRPRPAARAARCEAIALGDVSAIDPALGRVLMAADIEN
jgi:hypothetical protein